jgi:hypothetical protein
MNDLYDIHFQSEFYKICIRYHNINHLSTADHL